MTQNDITDRLDDLEAQLDDQQGTIEHQQERIDEQAETIERQQARLEEQDAIIQSQRQRLDEEATPASEAEPAGQDPAEPETPDENAEGRGPIATRRGVLTAGSVLGLLGLGAGSASADASGQIGTSSDPLKTLYTEELNGGVTDDTPLTNIAGSNLSIDNSGNLNAAGGGSGSWVEGDNTNLLEPDSKDGIEVDTVADNGSGSVTMNSTLDLTDNQINYGTNAGSQTLANLPFGSSQRAGSTNAYAMQLDGDDVLTINGVNDGSGNLNNAYVLANKELRLSGTLNTQDGTIENTTGGLTVTTNDNGNLTLDPGRSNEVDVESGGLDLNGKPLKSSSYGNVWDLRTSSNIGGSARTFALEINDDGSADNDITWQRAGNEDAAFRVVDRTNSNNLLTVNDGGDVDVHNGNLDVQSGTVENTTGGLAVTTNDNGNLTLDPGANNNLVLNNQQSNDASILTIDGSGNVGKGTKAISDISGSSSTLRTSNGDLAFEVIDTGSAPAIVGGSSSNQLNDNPDGGTPAGAVITGGGHSTSPNIIEHNWATIAGGSNNKVTGSKATIPGGESNHASGDWSFCAGRLAKANSKSGAFVWGDSSSTKVTAGAADEVRFQATGGFVIENGNLDAQGGTVENTTGGLTVKTDSNRVLKLGTVTQKTIEGLSTDAGGNVVAGHPNNTVNNAAGAVIGGGGGDRSVSISNTVSGDFGTIAGGYNNEVSGLGAMVPGGKNNIADGAFSFAGGQGAKTDGFDHVFVWGSGNTKATADSQARFQASGGFVVESGNIDAQGGTVENTTGALSLSTGSGDVDLQPSGNIDVNSNRISNAKEIHSDNNNITLKGSADLNLDGTRLTEKGGDMNIISTNSVNVDIDSDNNDTDGNRDFTVTKDGGATTLFTVNDGGEVDIFQGDLDMNSSGSVVNTSDARAKTAIEPIAHPIEKLTELQPRTYEWKAEEAADGREAGVIAQSVEDVLPEAVQEDEDGFLKLAYRQLTPLVIGAVQEQQTEIEKLEADLDDKDDRIADLEAENEQLRERNAELEDRLATVETELGIGASAGRQGVADD